MAFKKAGDDKSASAGLYPFASRVFSVMIRKSSCLIKAKFIKKVTMANYNSVKFCPQGANSFIFFPSQTDFYFAVFVIGCHKP